MFAVVVAHRPGEWFGETLESLALQDYEPLRVAVVDAAGSGIADQVRAVIDDAVVIDAAGSSGFAEAANAVLIADLEAEFLLVCHDDVALAPDAVSVMVAEAVRSRAGIVGPKLVDWDRPDVIQQAGYEVDRFGVGADRAGVEELDQEQHDGVSDVFALPSAALLVRRSLFTALGGFDGAMIHRGEDIDFCWRAQMAGARVMIVGGAVARHRARLVERTGVDDRFVAGARSSLRAMLVNHGRISLVILVPLALLMSLAEVVLALLTVRLRRARDVAAAWAWNVARLDVVAQRRQANAQIRRVRQADVTAMQYMGSVRVTSFVRRHFGGDQHGLLDAAGRGVLGGFRTGSARIAWVVWALAAAFVVFGSRSLIVEGVPAVGDLAPFPDKATDLLRAWWGGWSDRGTGSPSSNLGGLVFLGALGALLSNSMSLVRTLAVIAPIFVGLAGAYRLLAATGSRRAQTATLVAYLLAPLMPASVAAGSLPGLVGYAAAPWMLRGLLTASATTPFRVAGDPARSWLSSSVGLGAAAGVAALFAPAAAGLVAPMVAGLIVGGLLAGRPAGILRLAAAAVAAAPVAALVMFPSVVDVVASGPTWQAVADGRDGSAGTVSFGELLRFAVGPHDPGARVWLFALPMAVPLLLGRGWRLEQAVRLWLVAVASWALALAAQRGDLPFGLPDVQMLLAPAAVAVAALCGVAVLAVEHDLRFSHFGWRQALVPLVAAASLVLVAGSVSLLDSGRWGLAAADHHSTVRFDPPVLAGSYRVLWIGVPEHLPVEGRSLEPGLAWASTSGDSVTIVDRSVPVDLGRADLLESVVADIVAGRTARGGRMLAGLGVRYVVVLHRLAPAPFISADEAGPRPEAVASGLRSQLDLEIVEATNSAVEVFVNSAWVPVRSLQAPGFDRDVAEVADLEGRPFGPGVAVFSGDGPPWTGSVPGGAEVLVAHTPRPGWELHVDGEASVRREALSWARAYLPSESGEAVLSYSPPWWRRVGQLVGALAPVVLVFGWLRRRLEQAERL